MKRKELLKHFDYDWGSGDYDSKDGNYTIEKASGAWYLMRVIDRETHNEYVPCGEYKTLAGAFDFYTNLILIER